MSNSEMSRQRQDVRLWRIFGVVIAIGLLFTALNIDLPVIRNSFSYAKGALALVESGFNMLAVAHDATLTAGRPLLFSLLAAVFVALAGANAGTVMASAVGTIFFLYMVAVCLQRLMRHTDENGGSISLAFALTALNPLVIYQFWSAHPDSLFAGLVLAALLLTDIIATEPDRDTRWHIVALGAVIFLALHTKLYGAILAVACPAYLLMHWRRLRSSAHLRSKIAIGTLVALSLGALLVLARLQIYPFLDLESGMGAKEYARGLYAAALDQIVTSVETYALTALLAFHVALLFLLRRAAWRAWKAPAVIFIGIYLAGLLTYSATGNNIRYLLPAFPLVAAALALGASRFQPRARVAIATAYGIVATVAILHFNSVSVYKVLEPVVGDEAQQPRLLDSLRLPAQMALGEQIKYLNDHLSDRSTFYWLSNYYGTATHGLGHHLGIKDHIRIHYILSPAQIQRSSEPVYVLRFGLEPSPADLPAWARMSRLPSSLQSGILRLDPHGVVATADTNQ